MEGVQAGDAGEERGGGDAGGVVVMGGGDVEQGEIEPRTERRRGDHVGVKGLVHASRQPALESARRHIVMGRRRMRPTRRRPCKKRSRIS